MAEFALALLIALVVALLLAGLVSLLGSFPMFVEGEPVRGIIMILVGFFLMAASFWISLQIGILA